ncbi:glycosyltransferase family 4 protein [Chloroflexota bacterium]
MRILGVNKEPPYPRSIGGTEVIIGEVFSRLAQRGHSCSMVCGTPESESFPEHEVIRGIQVYYLKTHIPLMGRGKWGYLLSRYLFFVSNYRIAEEVAKREDADIIYEFVSPMPSAAPYVAKHLGIPCVARVWEYLGDRWHDSRDWITASIGRAVEQLTPRLPYSQFVSSSKDHQRLLIEQGHYPADRMRFVSQGIDLSRYEAATSTISGSPSILHVGRFVKVKGQLDLIRAAPQILREIPSARFVFVSDGPMLQQCQREVARSGITDKVEFKGRIRDDELATLYRNATVLVVPSLQECIPLVAWEAMACSVPVVLSDGPGVSEFVQQDYDAVIVKAADPDSLAQGTLRLLTDHALYNHIRQNALETVKQFDWSNVLPTEEKMLADVISNYRKSGDT